MATEQIGLELIHDNPYQARSTYHRQDIDGLAHSIKTHGLLQVPPGRRKDGNVELGFGHLRKRAFVKLAKKDPERWGKMPVDIRDLSDEQMAMFALEENLKRRDITPLETARAVDHYLNSFLEKTEVELAESLNMTKGNVSNMRRVLRLPEKLLEKIDNGTITFTQGRELLIFERFENAENLMRSALDGLKTGNKAFGEPNTVDGLQKSIHSVISGQCRPLDKEFQGYRYDLIFDTRAAGCLECEKMLRTHPTKSTTAHYCLDEKCWDRHQEEQKQKVSAEAKAKMEADILKRAAQEIAPEPAPPQYTLEKRGTGWIALDDTGLVIAMDREKEKAKTRAKAYYEPVATVVNPGAADYRLNHTYRICLKADRRPDGFIFDYTAQDLPTAVAAAGVSPDDIESVKVHKSSGKLGTSGGVSAGWSKCTEPMVADVSQEKSVLSAADEEQLEARADERDRGMEEARERANLERPVGEVPCDTCLKGETCDRSFFYIADDDSGRLICEQWECDHVSWATRTATPTNIPEDTLAMAKEKAGTRAEVLDLKDIGAGYYQEVKQGYALLDGVDRALEHIVDPDECLERCTHGFHYAFDSRQQGSRTRYVCTDTKCLVKKKSAFTREKNAEGQARKKAEVKAIKEAIDLVGQVTSDGKQLLDEEGKFANTVIVPRATLKLILLAQMDGHHMSRHYYGPTDGKQPETWLWDKVSAGTPGIDRTRAKLFKALDKLSDEQLAQLVVEFMFYYLTDKGDIGSYEIKTEEPLAWMGITVKVEEAKDHA